MTEERSRKRWWKKLLALMCGLAIAFLFAEVAVRVYFAFEVGPRILLYGSDWHRNVVPDQHEERRRKTEELFKEEGELHAKAESREDSLGFHSNEFEGYSKFFPHEKKTTRDVDRGERIPATINEHGFRGKSFDLEKPPGVIRILTLGSSSTFGYYDRDDETYPYYLENLLNERCPGDLRFEVVNFAIPHASSGNVAAMFLTEGVDLDPDVVTYYQGRNDSALIREYDGFFEKIYSVMIHRLLLVSLVDQALIGERLSVTAAAEKFEPYVGMRTDFYLGNLNAIREACQENDILFIVANQQSTSTSPFPRAEADRLPLKGVTYDHEAGQIQERMEKGGDVTSFEYSLLVHQRLMEELERWTEREDLPFVDIIEALDQDRHLLLTWVHLHPEANRIVARELAEKILPRFCP